MFGTEGPFVVRNGRREHRKQRPVVVYDADYESKPTDLEPLRNFRFRLVITGVREKAAIFKDRTILRLIAPTIQTGSPGSLQDRIDLNLEVPRDRAHKVGTTRQRPGSPTFNITGTIRALTRHGAPVITLNVGKLESPWLLSLDLRSFSKRAWSLLRTKMTITASATVSSRIGSSYERPWLVFTPYTLDVEKETWTYHPFLPGQAPELLLPRQPKEPSKKSKRRGTR